jgi:hypothetical protein
MGLPALSGERCQVAAAIYQLVRMAPQQFAEEIKGSSTLPLFEFCVPFYPQRSWPQPHLMGLFDHVFDEKVPSNLKCPLCGLAFEQCTRTTCNQ